MLNRIREYRDVAATAFQARGQVSVVRGIERHSGEPMTARHVGVPDYFERMIQRVFRDGYEVTDRREIWHALAFSELRRDPPVDLQLLHLPESYCRLLGADALEMPCWVLQIVSLDGTWDDVVGRFRRKMRTTDLPKVKRQIRKHQLCYRIARDRDELRRFYDAMYVAYAQARFGLLAHVDPYQDMLDDVAADGGLIQVLCGDRIVGGSDFCRHGETLEVNRFGLASDLSRPLSDAVRSATYLFALQHAHGAGFRKLSFGAAHPFVADGGYRFKRKWGAAVHATWMDSAILWQPVTFGPPVRAFFAENPMLVRTRRGLEGRILVNGDVDVSRLQRLVGEYMSPGVACLRFFGHQPSPCRDDDALPNVVWTDLSSTPDPQRQFVSQARSRWAWRSRRGRRVDSQPWRLPRAHRKG